MIRGPKEIAMMIDTIIAATASANAGDRFRKKAVAAAIKTAMLLMVSAMTCYLESAKNKRIRCSEHDNK
jgi:hypothetical protein